MRSTPRDRDASFHLIWCIPISISNRKYWHFFRNSRWRPPLDFQVVWIFTRQHVDSMVLENCTKFGSNIFYSHWDRCIYAPDVQIMTSHELISGFDIWSCGLLRMALVHLPTNLLKSVQWFCRCGWSKITLSHGHWLIQQLVLPYKP